MMRLLVTSCVTILAPFVTIIPLLPPAVVMGSVSLTVPFITDFVKYSKRGLAYAYLGVLFIFALSIVYLMLEFGI
jgi:hypothetical protein